MGKRGHWVNEGAAVIKRNEKIIITYSGSAVDENYAMGIIWADEKSNLMDGYLWNKSKEPIFTSSEKNRLYGPGCNPFTLSKDCTKDVLIFYARPEKYRDGDLLVNPKKHVHAKLSNIK